MYKNHASILLILQGWVDAHIIRPLDLALCRFVQQQSNEQDEAVLLAMALVSQQNAHGHVCLDLMATLKNPVRMLPNMDHTQASSQLICTQLRSMLACDLDDWLSRLQRSDAVYDHLHGAMDDQASPFVLAGSVQRPLFYLRRYFDYERRIRAGIETRLSAQRNIPETELKRLLTDLFKANDLPPDWQRIACALAARSSFFILTGGPGTGKTTTVIKLLAILQGLAAATHSPPLQIDLAAPTGKAAARLNESIAAQVKQVQDSLSRPFTATLPTEVRTLHRLLGSRLGSRHFRHDALNPLPSDVVVVDEASMVDVEMMACLIDAMRTDARLILLGDKDQLASVEAGAILGDLCQRAVNAHYTQETATWLKQITKQTIEAQMIDPAGRPLDQAIAMLRQSHRFDHQGGIGALAACINHPSADREQALQAVKQLFTASAKDGHSDSNQDLSVRELRIKTPKDAAFASFIRQGYAAYLKMIDEKPARDEPEQIDAWALRILREHRDFQLLTPLRVGEWGVAGLNQRIESVLNEAGLLRDKPIHSYVTQDAQRWFAGRPVMVTRNDYSLGLMNGDVGITLRIPLSSDHHEEKLRVAFFDTKGEVRWVLPSRLQAVETVFAMTVHKSQGSEFKHTALILPDKPNPVLTRELLYTAITRSRQYFTLLYGDNEDLLADALQNRVERVSGLLI